MTKQIPEIDNEADVDLFLDDTKQEDILGNSVVYTYSDKMPYGYAYDSGLVVIWEGGSEDMEAEWNENE